MLIQRCIYTGKLWHNDMLKARYPNATLHNCPSGVFSVYLSMG